ncbi:AUGMIN subunit [Sesamum alatum]|uniref:AUGMIN subunit n=1 Tax=Sesamum alatum TaxID=300844 RepID=A0AAE1XZX1_9LAMI|nr:AUGMIN subunit [Sesamum alatum]
MDNPFSQPAIIHFPNPSATVAATISIRNFKTSVLLSTPIISVRNSYSGAGNPDAAALLHPSLFIQTDAERIMSMGSDTTWVGKKPLRRVGGMSDALSIAADLGFSVPPPPSQEDIQNLSAGSGEKGDELIRILRELTAVQRKNCGSASGTQAEKR